MKRLLLPIAVMGALALGGAARGETSEPATGQSPAAFVPGEVLVKVGEGAERELALPPGIGVRQAVASLRANPAVDYAVPNYIAHASAFPPDPPNDPGKGGPADWQLLQWNFLAGNVISGNSQCPVAARCGVDARGAWQHLTDKGRPGASGVRIAVVDSGIAYRRLGRRYRRSPDFIKRQFAPGYDFVDRDKHPLDVFGHGTHVAGTIGERTNNGLYLTGLAYNAKIIPVRVLDSHGDGTASQVAKGIRFAADHNARVINMSFDFGTGLSGSQLPGVRDAIRYANGKGAILVASAGNNAKNRIPYPASGPKVISVGATTSHGCLASYSNRGTGSSSDKHLDIAAPGGGIDAAAGAPPCTGGSQPQIFQVTRNPQRRCCKRFAIVRHAGTSQAAPHVSAIAAMVLATGKVGGHPTPAQMLAHLVATGDPLPAPFDYVNLVDAAAATAP